MLTRPRRPLAAACILTLACVAAMTGTATAHATAAATTHAGTAASTAGWVRLAHLSPNTPPVDVYLYPFGGSNPVVQLKHVAYGDLSPYEALAPGGYLVAMRGAGAASSSNPVISTQVQVAAGRAYTVAGLGAQPGLTLQVLDDILTTTPGKAEVRLIEASLQSPTVSIVADTDPLASNLHFPNVTSYQSVEPGSRPLHVTTPLATRTTQLNFAADSTYTLAVLDGGTGTPKVLNLGDAVGSSKLPKGGVNTGFGGTANLRGPDSGSVMLWGTLLAAGLAAVGLGARRVYRNRRD